MKKSFPLSIVLIAFMLFAARAACAGSLGVDYLCELGEKYYERGDYVNALTEFKKALLIDPENEIALDYIAELEGQAPSRPVPAARTPAPAPRATYKKTEPAQRVYTPPVEQYTAVEQPEPPAQRTEAPPTKSYAKPKKQQQSTATESTQESGLKISGRLQASVGVDSDENDPIWKRANYDRSEENWRLLSENGLNQKENTFDEEIYQSVQVNVDTKNEYGPGFHTKIVVDPWSYVGQTDTVTLTGSNGDTAQLKLKTFGNDGYTLNETYYRTNNGLIINVPEIRTHGNHTTGTVVTDAWGNTITIPELKIDQQFQPMRELWFDYKQEGLKFRIYPFGYEDQTVVFDDPLTLSGNRNWWEESPWIRQWKPGVYHSGNTPVDFTRGYWDNSLTFGTKDSEGNRLTLLRGMTLDMGSRDETHLVTSVASSKDPWQDYSDYDNVVSASRLTQRIGESVIIGASTTERLGFNAEDKNKTDARNIVGAVDATVEITPGLMTSLEAATSKSSYDLTSDGYRTDERGNAFFGSIIGRNGGTSVIDTPAGYNGIKPEKGEQLFTKWRLIGAHMDESFDPSLSSYAATRDDEFWSRHIHFREPYKFYNFGLDDLSPRTYADVVPYAIGNGIDVGRDVIGLRLENALWDSKIQNLIDARNVHDTDGKYVETAARDELTIKVTDKLTFKGLGLYQDMPRTHAGVDPFLVDPVTGRYYDNNQILDGTDPSIKTGSVGLNYDFFDWLSVNGTWERTNDYYLGYDAFPRGLLNAKNGFLTYEMYDKFYRYNEAWLYNQQYFPNAPYPSYDIFKAGLRLAPAENLEIYLSHTRNEYEMAGAIDDNINHSGIEVYYMPFKRLSLNFMYQYSRWKDIDQITQENQNVNTHHNFAAQIMYLISENQDLSLLFGEESCIDTAHLIRLYYRLRF